VTPQEELVAVISDQVYGHLVDCALAGGAPQALAVEAACVRAFIYLCATRAVGAHRAAADPACLAATVRADFEQVLRIVVPGLAPNWPRRT
jgi:hypothetical protein